MYYRPQPNTYRCNVYTPKQRHYGTNAYPGVRCDKVELELSEYICAAGGRVGNVCHQLWFKTNSGRLISLGGVDGVQDDGDKKTYDTSKAEKPLIVALGAGIGGKLHHAKVYYLDLMNPAVVAAPGNNI